MRIKYIIYTLVLFLGSQSCSIDEEIKDESLGENLLASSSPEAILSPVYSISRGIYGHRVLFSLQTYASDEGMLPQRLTDWFDGGVFIDLQQHSWLPTHAYTTQTWNDISSGIGRAINAIDLLPQNSTESAEATGLLGFYMLLALDNFGQVPYRDITDIDFSADPEILKGLDAVNKIITVMETALPNLPSGKNSVRFTQDAAKGVLARLYLNKAVFVDRYAGSFNFENADMQKVIDLTTQVINSPSHALESQDFFSMFDINNEDHSEIIFAIRNELDSPKINNQNVNRNSSNGMSGGLHLTDRPLVGGGYYGGSDAGCTLPGFADKWDQNDSRFFSQRLHLPPGGEPAGPYFDVVSTDTNGTQVVTLKLEVQATPGVSNTTGDGGPVRLPLGYWLVAKDAPLINRGFLRGQQFGPYIKDNQNDRAYHYLRDSIVFCALITKGNIPADFTREVQVQAINRATGFRSMKYEMDTGAKDRSFSRVDIPVFRLADMYLMRAEAKLRSGGSADSDVNMIRQTRNPGFAPLSGVTLEQVLDERGFEFYWEYHRRTDQIRFGKWEDSWQSKTSSDPNRRLFPIPPSVVAFNPGIDQNPGY